MKTSNNKIWEKEEIVPIYTNNKENVEKELKELGITKLSAFDDEGTETNTWTANKEMTLLILPLIEGVIDSETETRVKLRVEGWTIKKNYYPIDIHTEEIIKDLGGIIIYFIEKNKIVTLINPFADNKAYEQLKKELRAIKPKIVNEQDIQIERLTKDFTKLQEEEKERNEEILSREKRELENAQARMLRAHEKIVHAKRIMEMIGMKKKEIGDKIREEIKRLKEMPIVKNIEIKDGIMINIGEVNIIARIRRGTRKEEGIEVPNYVNEKVNIGELCFEIKQDTIKVKNLTYPTLENQHPHAGSGNICFGELGNKAIEQLASLKLTDMAKTLYSWAFSYNEKDAYIKMEELANAIEIIKKRKSE